MEITLTIKDPTVDALKALAPFMGGKADSAKPAATASAGPAKIAAAKETTHTLDSLRTIMAAKKTEGKTDAIKTLLTELGAEGLTKLPKEKYNEFHDKLIKL